VDDEHGRSSECLDSFALVEHLHEVRSADQSAGMPEKRDEHRAADHVTEVEERPIEGRQLEWRRRIANCRRGVIALVHCSAW